MMKLFILIFIIFLKSLTGPVHARTFELRGSLLFNEDDFLIEKNWHQLDFYQNEIPGISYLATMEKFSEEIDNGEEVIIAVIDSGIDINHIDFKDRIWTNDKEIPNNQIDDDKNGYIDDYKGWNFLGNNKGHGYFIFDNFTYKGFEKGNVQHQLYSDSYSLVREYLDLKILPESNKTRLQELKSEIDRKLKRAKKLLDEYLLDKKIFLHSIEILKEYNVSTEKISIDTLNSIEAKNAQEQNALDALRNFLFNDIDLSFIDEQIDMYQNQFAIQYNPLSNHRAVLVNDCPNTLVEKGYGNNDVIGPSPLHGTHVSGVIVSQTKKTKIMPIRAIPNGDERDKDIINAIYYAVDNGAKIINMSFGKYYSSKEKEVQRALLYAKEKNVLIVQASGNDYLNLDKTTSFPNPKINKKRLNNYITVASSTSFADETLVSTFSNFGKTTVDMLAPGSGIYSTIPDNKYATLSGTSIAAPMVSAIAANLFSQNKNLYPMEVKQLILSGTQKFPDLLIEKPNVEISPLKELFITPGVVNMAKSFELYFDYYSQQNIL